MPRLLVAFCSRTGATAQVADALAHGAEHVRFTEVDVRLLADAAPRAVIGGVPAWAAAREALAARYPELSMPDVAAYDGIILAATSRDGQVPGELTNFLDAIDRQLGADKLADKVMAALLGGPAEHARTANNAALVRLAQSGGIIVPSAFQAGDESATLAAARRLGKRVARLVGWTTHGLGHEQGHAHHH